MRRAILRAAVALATAALLTAPHGTPAHAAGAPTATFTKDSGWGTGYQGTYTITNGGPTTLNGWKVEFDLPAGGSVGSYWDALMTQSGTHYTFTNRDYNGTLAPGASASFGWNGAPESATPLNCTLNGQPCADGGGGGGDTTPPSAPGGLHVTGTTSSSISLAWTASTDDTGVTGYRVYEGASVVATATAASATVGGLAAGSGHTYTVTARDAAGNESAPSAPVTATTQSSGGGGGGSYQKVGYYPQWGIYGRDYWIKDLDTTGAAGKLTVLNYAFENIDPANLTCFDTTKSTSTNPQDPDQGTGAGDAYADYGDSVPAANSVDGVADTWDQKLKGNFNQIKKLKAKYPNLKVLVSLGGWTYSTFFSDVAKTDASRKKFVSSCIDMFIKGNLPVSSDGTGGPGTGAGVFDGFDIDWEWPGSPDGHPGNHYGADDKANLAALLAEFRGELDALGGPHRLLTAFTPADPAKVAAGWDLSRIFDSLDFANIQGYDFHGAGSDNSWEPNRTGHQANLYDDPNDPYPTHFSVDSAVRVYTGAGVSPRKLTIGIPFYGRGWQQVADGGKNGVWQAANGAAPGDFPEEAGTRGYKNIAANVPGCTVHHDTQAVATYCYTGANGQWWSFDDPWSIGQKTGYVKANNLLGAMIWEMSGDTGTLMTALDDGLR